MGNLKVGLFALLGAVVTGIVAKATSICPDLIGQIPAILIAGVMAGIGLWMQTPKGVSGK
jgi:hypothetical protein